MADTLLLQKKN